MPDAKTLHPEGVIHTEITVPDPDPRIVTEAPADHGKPITFSFDLYALPNATDALWNGSEIISGRIEDVLRNDPRVRAALERYGITILLTGLSK